RTCRAGAGLAPTSTAASPGVTPLAWSARISTWSSVRSWSPTLVPSINLAGKVHRARFADHDHLDLPGVLQLALDAARDLVGQLTGGAVVHRGGRHLDPELHVRAVVFVGEHLADVV